MPADSARTWLEGRQPPGYEENRSRAAGPDASAGPGTGQGEKVSGHLSLI